jgi:hypothetical protein
MVLTRLISGLFSQRSSLAGSVRDDRSDAGSDAASDAASDAESKASVRTSWLNYFKKIPEEDEGKFDDDSIGKFWDDDDSVGGSRHDDDSVKEDVHKPSYECKITPNACDGFKEVVQNQLMIMRITPDDFLSLWNMQVVFEDKKHDSLHLNESYLTMIINVAKKAPATYNVQKLFAQYVRKAWAANKTDWTIWYLIALKYNFELIIYEKNDRDKKLEIKEIWGSAPTKCAMLHDKGCFSRLYDMDTHRYERWPTSIEYSDVYFYKIY